MVKVIGKAKAKTAAKKKAVKKDGTIVGDHEAQKAVDAEQVHARHLDARRTSAEKVARILDLSFPDFTALEATTIEVDGLSLEARLLRDVQAYEDQGRKLSTTYLMTTRRMYTSKKHGLGFLVVKNKSEPIDSVFASALSVLTASKYLTKKTMSPLRSFMLTSRGLNQRCFVWLLKAMMEVKATNPTGSSLWIDVMEFIKRTGMDTQYDELAHVKLFMDEALVKQYSLVKGHIGLAGFIETQRNALSLILDVEKLKGVLAAKSDSDQTTITPAVMEIMGTSIGSSLVSFLYARCVAASISGFIEKAFLELGSNVLSDEFVTDLTGKCMAEFRRLGFEET